MLTTAETLAVLPRRISTFVDVQILAQHRIEIEISPSPKSLSTFSDMVWGFFTNTIQNISEFDKLTLHLMFKAAQCWETPLVFNIGRTLNLYRTCVLTHVLPTVADAPFSKRQSWSSGWNLFCHPSECRCFLPDAPKLSHCEPAAHPFVHQHVYSWRNSHCGTSRSCRRKSGRVLCISKPTTCQRQTHKRIIWERRWRWWGETGVHIQLLCSAQHPYRKWTPEDLHLAVHSRSLDQVTAGALHISAQINSLLCMDDLQRGEPAREHKDNQRPMSLPVDQQTSRGVQGTRHQQQSTI